jgi:hypothetical protein
VEVTSSSNSGVDGYSSACVLLESVTWNSKYRVAESGVRRVVHEISAQIHVHVCLKVAGLESYTHMNYAL